MERDEFIMILQKLGFSKSISGDISKENEYIFEQLKITIMKDGWVLSKWDIPLRGNDNNLYSYINEFEGFDTSEFFKVMMKHKK